MSRLILGSASTSRARILTGAGIEFSVLVSTVDEDAELARAQQAGTVAKNSLAEAEFLAAIKAASVAANPAAQGSFVLGCDSVFELGDTSYGKPYTEERAFERWLLMRGKTGTLHTGHTLIDNRPDSPSYGKQVSMPASSEVTFGHPSDEQLRRYVRTGEPQGCAGGFTIDGHAAAFIEHLSGDHNAVIGVSVAVLAQLMGQLGADITDFWTDTGPH